MLRTFESLRKKINSLGLPSILFLLFIFFLPFQERHYKSLKKLTKMAFAGQFLPPFFFEKFLDFYLGDFFLIALLLIFVFIHKIKPILATQKFLILFLFFTLLSIPLSGSGTHLWPYWRWLQFSLPLLACFLVIPKLDLKKLLPICFWILSMTALFECILTISQYINQESIGFKALGELNQHWDYSAGFWMKNRQRWLFDSLLGLKAPGEKILRPSGTFPHPNMLGGFLGLALCATSYLFTVVKKLSLKSLLSVGICLQIFAISLTFSRGAIFGVLLSFLIFFVSLFFKFKLRKLALKLLLVFALGGSISGIILHKQLLQRGGIINYNITSKLSDEPRIYYQNIALEMAKTKPLLGHGWGQYVLEMNQFRGGREHFLIQKVHNIYLLILAETGILGLLSFLAFLGSLFYTFWKREIDLMSMSLLSILVFILWFGCVDHFWIGMEQGREIFALMSALFFSYALLQRESLELQTQLN